MYCRTKKVVDLFFESVWVTLDVRRGRAMAKGGMFAYEKAKAIYQRIRLMRRGSCVRTRSDRHRGITRLNGGKGTIQRALRVCKRLDGPG
jgi:hypothetical protein